MNRVEEFCNNGNPAAEWNRLERHPIEYAITLRAMQEYLPPAPARIVDIGGGPGRYAIALAQRGYRVTLVDLSHRLLDVARAKASEARVELEDYVHADAQDLSSFPAAEFDAALLMGPLYHLLDHAQRLAALRQTSRVLRPKGTVMAAFLNRYNTIMWGAAESPEYVLASRDEVEAILATGIYRRPPEGGFIDAWFAHPSQIPPLMTEAGFAPIQVLAQESVVNEMDQPPACLLIVPRDSPAFARTTPSSDPSPTCGRPISGHSAHQPQYSGNESILPIDRHPTCRSQAGT